MRTCPFPDCMVRIPDAMFGCRPHWFSLSKEHQQRIYRAYDAYKAQRIGLLELRALQQAVLDEHFARSA
jgi:hypothetical protein